MKKAFISLFFLNILIVSINGKGSHSSRVLCDTLLTQDNCDTRCYCGWCNSTETCMNLDSPIKECFNATITNRNKSMCDQNSRTNMIIILVNAIALIILLIMLIIFYKCYRPKK